MWLRKSAFVAALVGNLKQILDGRTVTGASSPLLECLLFVRRNFPSILFVNLKTKSVTPLSEACG